MVTPHRGSVQRTALNVTAAAVSQRRPPLILWCHCSLVSGTYPAAAAADAAADAVRSQCVGQWCGECLLYTDSVVVSPGCNVRDILNWATTAAGGCVAQSVSAKTGGQEGASGQEGATCEQVSRELCCLQEDTVQVGVPGESKHWAGCIQ